MSRPTDSPMMSMAALAVVVVVAIGMTRDGFSAAQNATNASDFANTTPGELEVFAGVMTELLPVLVLVLAGVVVARTVL